MLRRDSSVQGRYFSEALSCQAEGGPAPQPHPLPSHFLPVVVDMGSVLERSLA